MGLCLGRLLHYCQYNIAVEELDCKEFYNVDVQRCSKAIFGQGQAEGKWGIY